uniref:Uncharacterized protein n=1 Tax=Oryza sativa subsp. japonica TaxID=39947 RepID=Q7Y0D7_ORYSJ|nr:hypothetical protein [Oryza sativa Japonica Group]
MSRFRVVEDEAEADLQALARRFSFSSSSSPSPSPSPPSSSRKPPLPPRRSPQKRPGLPTIPENGPPAGMATATATPKRTRTPTSTCAPPPPPHARHAPMTGQTPVAGSRSSRPPRGRGQMEVDSPQPSRALHTPPTGQRQVTRHPPPAARTMFQESPVASVSPPQQQQVAVPVSAALREFERRRAAAAAEAALRQLQLQVWEAARQQSQQLRLYTVEGRAAGYGTKWVELHPQSQELLLHIEYGLLRILDLLLGDWGDVHRVLHFWGNPSWGSLSRLPCIFPFFRNKMREYKHESDLLDQCSRLYDPSVSSRSFELYATQISQEIGSTSTIMDREMVSIRSLMAVVEEMMRNTDSAIRSYQKLRPNFIRRYSGTANTGFAHHAGPSGAPTYFNQPSAIVPTFDFYSGVAMRPSPFMQHTVSKFENRLEECSRMVGELEQLIQIKNDKNYSNAFESLSTVVPNVYDYLIHVATQVENLHQYAEVMRTHYRNAWRLMGDCSDPFLEADRREAAKQEATARIVHPTGVDVSVLASQPLQLSSPTGVTSSSTRAILRTPLSALPWFSIQTSPAPSPSPFSSSGSMLQPTPFGSASTLALGSTPARFASSALGGTSLFRTPPGDALVFQTYSTQSVNCDYCTILSLTMPEKCQPTLTKSVTRQ